MYKEKSIVSRTLSLLIVLALVLGTLAGCGGGKNGGGSEDVGANGGEDGTASLASGVEMGRYVEEKLDFDEEFSQVYSPFYDGGSLIFYADDYETGSIARVVYKDGKLEKTYPPLINELEGAFGYRNISESPNGSLTIMYYDENREYRLARIADGEISYVEVEGWMSWAEYSAMQEAITEGNYEEQEMGLLPSAAYALDDGFLVLYMFERIIQYDAEGAKVHEYEVSTGLTGFAVYDRTLAVLDVFTEEIITYNLETGSPIDVIPCGDVMASANAKSTAGSMMLMATGDIYLSYDETGLSLSFVSGIYVYDDGFRLVVDGSMTSLALSTVQIECFANTGDGFLAVLSKMGVFEFARYTYRDDVPTLPSVVMEIWSLRNNLTIRQAIGEYQQANPDVRINMRVVMEDDMSMTAEDVVRALNTEILAGKGPDLIVLDGLPVAAYIEKGVLKDISTLLDKLSASGGLLENMKNTFAGDNGAVYGIPAKYTLPIMFGESDAISRINSVSDLAALTEERHNEDFAFLFPTFEFFYDYTTGEPLTTGIMMRYFDVYANLFQNADRSVNEENIAAYLDDMLKIERAINEYPHEEMSQGSYGMGGRSGGYETMDMSPDFIARGEAGVSLITMMGPYTLMLLANRLYETEGISLASQFNSNAYYPVCGIGVLTTGSRQDYAEDFIELLLSDSIQEIPLGDGFPVNPRAMDSMLNEVFESWMMENDADEFPDMGFAEIAASLSKPIIPDNMIKEAVKSQIAALQDGTATPEEAAKNVTNATRLYLAE